MSILRLYPQGLGKGPKLQATSYKLQA